MDIVEPTTETENGNKYILFWSDYVSRFVKHDCFPCVQILLNHKANIEETNMYEETDLIYAVKTHNGRIIEALLERKADIRATNRNNETVTDIALSEDNIY